MIAKKSTDLDVAADLGGPVDVLVSEIVSNDILAEEALAGWPTRWRGCSSPAGG